MYRIRDRPRRALTCRQCKFCSGCTDSNQIRPCTDFQPRKEDMSKRDWLYVGLLIIGIYAGMIVTYIAMA